MLPSNVRLFEQLMYISITIGIVLAVAQDIENPKLFAALGVVLVVQAIIFVLFTLLIWLIARRRKNWGRWVLLILWVVGIVPFAIGLAATFATDIFFGVTQVVQAILQLAALYLIFTGNAKFWFQKA